MHRLGGTLRSIVMFTLGVLLFCCDGANEVGVGKSATPNLDLELAERMQQLGSGCDGVSKDTAPEPEACTLEYSPVCSCSGLTYANACVAASNGKAVAYSGPCKEKQ